MVRRRILSHLQYRVFFVTTTVLEWQFIFTSEFLKKLLVNSLDHYCKKYQASLIGYVIMSNHIHFIICFNAQNELASFMRDFKKWTSVEIKRYLLEKEPNKLPLFFFKGPKGQTFKLWADRYDYVYLVTRNIARIKLNYIHKNPVKAGMVDRPEDYQYSSAAYYTDGRQGDVPILHFNDVF